MDEIDEMKRATPHIDEKSPRDRFLTGAKRTYADLKDVKPEVIAALAADDEGAFKEVYLHYRRSLEEFAYCLVHSREDAEEITQDVYAQLWQNRARMKDIKHFKSYLYQAAKNGAWKVLEKRKVAKKYTDFRNNSQPDFSDDPHEIYRAGEMALLMKISVDNMPETQRAVFRMSSEEGLTNSQIAEKLQITNHAVSMHLYKARKSLKELATIFIFLFISQ